jgi:dTDP-4-dehydrorhamnose 3,5-epimerase
MKVVSSKLSGCYEILPEIFRDERGEFIKTFHSDTFKNLNLCSDFREEYYSISGKNVLRGLHFQLPPEDHVKLVYCTSGMAMDVVVDLRVDSITYGQHEIFELSPLKANSVYIPSGMAHGFYAMQDNTVMIYKTSTVYSPGNDSGLRWNSVDVNWPEKDYILSERDKHLVTFENFESPFTMGF